MPHLSKWLWFDYWCYDYVFCLMEICICLKIFLDLFAWDLQASWWCVRCNVDSWQRCTTSSNDAISGRCKEWCEKAAVKYMHYCRVWYRFLSERDYIYFCELLCNKTYFFSLLLCNSIYQIFDQWKFKNLVFPWSQLGSTNDQILIQMALLSSAWGKFREPCAQSM